MDCSAVQNVADGVAHTLRCVEPDTPLWRTLLSPGLILVSAIIAFIGIRNTRAIARQKATLDAIEKFESTEHYRLLNESFSAVRKADRFGALHNPANDGDKVLRGKVQDYLNHYELVGIGIRNDILDARIYREWMGSVVVRDWNAAAPYVHQERWRLHENGRQFVYHDQLYKNLQWLAAKFGKGKAVHYDRWTTPEPVLKDAGGPGDDPLPVLSEEN